MSNHHILCTSWRLECLQNNLYRLSHRCILNNRRDMKGNDQCICNMIVSRKCIHQISSKWHSRWDMVCTILHGWLSNSNHWRSQDNLLNRYKSRNLHDICSTYYQLRNIRFCTPYRSLWSRLRSSHHLKYTFLRIGMNISQERLHNLCRLKPFLFTSSSNQSKFHTLQPPVDIECICFYRK